MKSYLRLAAIVTALSLPAAGAAFADEASARPTPTAGATDTSKPALKKVAKGAKKKTEKKAPAKGTTAPAAPTK